MKNLEELKSGFETAFINYQESSSEKFRPKFISNDYKKGKKVLSSIEEGLLNCDKFFISVAFITDNGIEPLLQTLKELEEKNIPGKILTTDYLYFSSPKALKKLNKLKNIELRMFRVKDGPGFHTKGYIFNKGELYNIIVGSSNMTSSALTTNTEWNTKIVSTIDGEFAREMLIEFDYYWNQAESIADLIDVYSEIYENQQRIARENAKNSKLIDFAVSTMKPNQMQIEFTNRLNQIMRDGGQRALLISATGTGKTFASAFGLKDAEGNPFKKILFVVHREQIARQAAESYKKVFGPQYSFGSFVGNKKEYDKDIIFATVQTLSKDENLKEFDKKYFDAIVIDEVHRAGAYSHQKIINYFEPKMFLGMTASPERTDGYDIFNLFDHNIACEIRLKEAMEGDYLCPFHYFGISDFQVNGKTIDDKTDFNNLIVDSRVEHIIEKIEYFGYSGNRVKGLMFCSRKDEAKILSEKFNERGYKTKYLSGEDSQEEREEAIRKLVSDDIDDYLDYIFTVDIFNEGVDIPEINQIVMLRPTQSPIVFVQQLGRGLRKYPNKEFVVVIDFIGNYKNNFMIPIALYGDRSYNKDTIRKHVLDGSKVIPGESTVHFDAISRNRMFEKINKMSNTKKMLVDSYVNLKNKLGKVPSIVDFYNYGEIDPLLILEYAQKSSNFEATKGTYEGFVSLIDKDYKNDFNERENTILSFISSDIVKGKRIHELLMIKILIENGKFSKEEFEEAIKKYDGSYSEESFESSIRVLNKTFSTENEKVKFRDANLIEKENGNIVIHSDFKNALKDEKFVNAIMKLIALGCKKYNEKYINHDDNGFALYEKYSRKDALRLLGWEKNEESTVYGYRIKHNTCPIFVTYNKDQDITSSTKYKDSFVNENTFQWATRNRVTLDSDEAKKIMAHKESGLTIPLFIKKSDGEGSDFYYMGCVDSIIDEKEEKMKNDKGEELPVVHFGFKLKNEVRKDIYEYFVEGA